MIKRAVIVQAKRTPVGKENGIFRNYQPHELIKPVLQQLANGIENTIDEVILGNVVGQGGNVARLSALEAGLPLNITGVTLDRQCSAGLEAIRMACYFIQGGAGCCYIAGGVESTSTSPYENRARFSPDSIGDPDMGVAAEHVAQKFKISRKKQDEYALLSYKRSRTAYTNGIYKEEIVPVNGLEQDEELLRERKMERLVERAKPIFVENGTVTAANSCAIHDGACATVVMEESLAKEMGFTPILRFLDSEVSGIHPFYPGYAPVSAIEKLLDRNKLTIKDIDFIEINEAFASKIVACSDALAIPYDKLNVSGGALTVGHPYAASGAMLVTRLFYEVQRNRNAKYVLAAIGSAGGVGVAVLFEVC